ncbi:MAG: DNA repair protein RecN [bacterium]
MLLELSIHDFALIDEAVIVFGPGLNVLTGETGAGKSILVEALGCVAGARAREEWIREGRSAARITALFRLDAADPRIAELAEDGIDPDDGDVILRRELVRGGRGRAWVNGTPVTLAQLRRIGEQLVDFHGQHESHTLFSPARHLEILDEFARTGEDRAAVARAFDAREEARRAYEEDAAAVARIREARASLEKELREIDEVGAQPGEEERLEEERRALSHRAKLVAILDRADAGLSADGSAAARADQALRALREGAALDPRLGDAEKLVASALIELSEAAAAVSALRRNLDESEGRVDAIMTRLDALARLRRRYGGSVERAIERRAEIARDLARADAGEGRAEDLAIALGAAERDLAARASRLSKARAAASDRFTDAVARGLRELGMREAAFSLALEARDAACATRTGVDTVEFFLAPNPGEGRHALARIASGGELSRVLLAILTALGDGYGAAVSVFDEVDTGVGADLAASLGAKLRAASLRRQVLVITHFAQIAAQADGHLRVSKQTRAGRTRVGVERLDGESRRREVSRMLGGEGDVALRHADELLATRRTTPAPRPSPAATRVTSSAASRRGAS